MISDDERQRGMVRAKIYWRRDIKSYRNGLLHDGVEKNELIMTKAPDGRLGIFKVLNVIRTVDMSYPGTTFLMVGIDDV